MTFGTFGTFGILGTFDNIGTFGTFILSRHTLTLSQWSGPVGDRLVGFWLHMEQF